MMLFPGGELLSEQDCHDFILNVLHPDGLRCPEGHGLPPLQAPHDRSREPIFDYRCRSCGRVFNLFTGTLWQKSRYSCRKIVLILRGLMEGIPVARLARNLDIDRSHLQKRRRDIDRLIEEYLVPLERE